MPFWIIFFIFAFVLSVFTNNWKQWGIGLGLIIVIIIASGLYVGTELGLIGVQLLLFAMIAGGARYGYESRREKREEEEKADIDR